MSVELAALVSSLTAINSISKTVIDALKAAKLDAEIGKFQKAILEANSYALAIQQQQFSLVARVQELEKENARLKDWSSEKENYVFREIAVGVFAYTEKRFTGNLESAKKLCCNCFDQGRKSILQQAQGKGERGICKFLTCPNCQPRLEFFNYNPPVPVI